MGENSCGKKNLFIVIDIFVIQTVVKSASALLPRLVSWFALCCYFLGRCECFVVVAAFLVDSVVGAVVVSFSY